MRRELARFFVAGTARGRDGRAAGGACCHATENPPGKNYRACADFLEKRLRQCGLECERLEAGDSKRGCGGQPCQSDCDLWTGETRFLLSRTLRCCSGAVERAIPAFAKRPFFVWPRLLRHEGRDCSHALCHSRVESIGAETRRGNRLTLVPNEETGGEGGSGWLAAQGRLGPRRIGMLLAEPTSGAVWNANRGAISLRVRVLGKSAHVGLQHQGENAFERMHRVVERLQELKQECSGNH